MKYQAVIIGGGIVGLTLACALAEAQISVALVEREDIAARLGQNFDGRVTSIAYGSWQILESIGVAQALLPDAGIIKHIRISDGTAGSFLHFDNKLVGDVPLGYMVPNEKIVAALYERALQYQNLQLLAGTKYKLVECAENLARVQLADGRELEAELLIGADGKGSDLRSMQQISVQTRDFKQRALVFNIRHEIPHQNIAQEIFYKSGPFAVLPLKDEHSSCIVWTEPSKTGELLMRMPQAELTEMLQIKLGGHMGKAEIINQPKSHALSLTMAERYYATRFLLIGDAAHHIHPVAGQGVNLGFRDVAALVALCAKATDLGAEDLLASYQATRMGDNMRMAMMTGFLVWVFGREIPMLPVARRAALAFINSRSALKKYFMQQAMYGE